MPHRPPIHWQFLTDTLAHYQSQGYAYIEAPWLVPTAVIDITAPRLNEVFNTAEGYLVGSAEQGFLHLMQQGELPAGRYCALTPCFREEAPHTNLRRPYFMKVELIDTTGSDQTAAMVNAAQQWLGSLGNQPVTQVVTASGIDLEVNQIEVGSYGFRRHDGLCWTYGTGIAEPRFSQALAQTSANADTAATPA